MWERVRCKGITQPLLHDGRRSAGLEPCTAARKGSFRDRVEGEKENEIELQGPLEISGGLTQQQQQKE